MLPSFFYFISKEVVRINNDELQIIVQAIVDKQESEKLINAQISQIKAKALEMEVVISDKDARKQLAEFQKQVETAAKTHKSKVNIEANLDFNKEKLSKSIDLALEKIKNNPSFNEIADKLRSMQSEIQGADKTKLTSLNKEFQNVNSSIRLTNEAIRQVNSSIKFDLERARFSNSIEKWAQDNSRAMKSLSPDIQAIISQIQSADRVTLDRLKTQFEGVKAKAREAGIEGRSFGDSFKEAFGRLTQYFTIAKVFQLATQEIKKMIVVVRELDAAMLEMRKVTDETDATYTKFFNNASVRANKLGAELKEVITASADFARLGFGISDAEKLADVAILYKNVGDGINDISQASESIISTLKAFNISVSDSQHIVDAFNETGNNFAISSKGVGDALLRSASSLSAANNTLEESIGLIVAANNVVQDPDVVGTALKTVSMRLRNTAGQLEELGEDAEGAAESVTKLQTQLLNLTQGRVDIMLDNETFKSTYQIVTEIAAVWDSLSDTAQADITRLVAGVRQGNVWDALVKGMAEGAKATESAINSQNSALEENSKYLDSINGKVAQYNAATQKLSSNLVDTNIIKSLVDTGTGFLNILNSIIEKAGLLPPILASIVAITSLKNSNAGKVNMPTIYEVTQDTSMWESCAYHTGGKPLDCWKGLRAA